MLPSCIALTGDNFLQLVEAVAALTFAGPLVAYFVVTAVRAVFDLVGEAHK